MGAQKPYVAVLYPVMLLYLSWSPLVFSPVLYYLSMHVKVPILYYFKHPPMLETVTATFIPSDIWPRVSCLNQS